MSYQACIFDLDGTLCDSVESMAFCANRALRELGMKEATVEQYKIFVGDGVDELVRRLLRHAGDEKAVHFEELKSLYMEYFEEGCMYRVKPYPGIVPMLEKLKKEGAKLCVLSNKPHKNTEDVIFQVFGTEMFDFVQGQTDDIARKPDPEGALLLAERMKIAPGNCLYVGDTGTDMKTGKAAGMYTTGVLWGFRTEQELLSSGADCVISRADELLDIYRGIQAVKRGRE